MLEGHRTLKALASARRPGDPRPRPAGAGSASRRRGPTSPATSPGWTPTQTRHEDPAARPAAAARRRPGLERPARPAREGSRRRRARRLLRRPAGGAEAGRRRAADAGGRPASGWRPTSPRCAPRWRRRAWACGWSPSRCPRPRCWTRCWPGPASDRLMVFNGVMLDEMARAPSPTPTCCWAGRCRRPQVADFVRRHANSPAPAARPQWLADSARAAGAVRRDRPGQRRADADQPGDRRRPASRRPAGPGGAGRGARPGEGRAAAAGHRPDGLRRARRRRALRPPPRSTASMARYGAAVQAAGREARRRRRA